MLRGPTYQWDECVGCVRERPRLLNGNNPPKPEISTGHPTLFWKNEMADITMCTQTLCPNAGHCYRVQAKPSPHWQSMMDFPYTISIRGVECANYIPAVQVKVTNTTEG